MKKILSLSIVIIGVYMLNSCGNGNVATADVEKIDSTEINMSEEPIVKVYAKFKFPSPMELFFLLHDEGVKFNSEYVNDIEKLNSYSKSDRLAIAMGVYSSDLSYCSMYGKNQLTLNYFAATKSLADKLGLSSGFDEDKMKRLDANISNPDSLINLTSNSYNEAVAVLEEQGRTEILPYLVFGEWIESMYIVVNLTEKYSPDDIGVNILSEQSLLFENIYEYFNSNKIQESNEALYNDVQELYEMYIELYNNEGEDITEEQFNNIKAKVSEIRNNWV